jgi:hypothetical protein
LGDAAEKAQIEVALGDIYFTEMHLFRRSQDIRRHLGGLLSSNESYLRVKFRADLLGELVPHLLRLRCGTVYGNSPVTQEIREMAADKADSGIVPDRRYLKLDG